MSAAEPAPEGWGSDFDLPQRKARVPVLAWVLGVGCLSLTLIGIAVLVIAGRFIGRATDPDVQWQRLAAVLPFDEPPPSVDPRSILGLTVGNASVWVMRTRDAKNQVMLMHVGSAAGGARAALFPPGEDAQKGERLTVPVQGLALPAARSPGGADAFEGQESFHETLAKILSPGPSLSVQLTPPDASQLLFVQWTLLESAEEVPVEPVVEFLESFRLGELW